MDVLVVGGGGREHAICAALKKSKDIGRLFCAPGNAGIAEIATCVPVSAMDFKGILKLVKTEKIDLVFVAPDDPLAGGLVDLLQKNGIRAFGPTKDAAILEASKVFSKGFMERHDIPTAKYRAFSELSPALEYLKTCDFPIVVKADGLALGKGVVVAKDFEEAEDALLMIMQDRVFGDSGREVVIEEYLEGKEVTVLAFTDGKTIRCMPASQDHKKAYDGDLGPNTGGMGAFCPTLSYTADLESEATRKIILPTIKGLKEEGRTFSGVIYFGLMLTEKGVKVIEYNARFGDPETQAILPLLKSDFLEIVNAIVDGRLAEAEIEWEKKTGFCLVAASGGYPQNVVKGFPIEIGALDPRVILYHSGTAEKDGALVTNGGRVLCLVTVGENIESCRELTYREIKKINFEGMRYRKDIGIK